MMNTVPLIDSHAHLSRSDMIGTIDELLTRAQSSGIKAIVNICTDLDTLSLGLELAKKYPWIYNAGATTPHDVEKEGEKFFSTFAHHAHAGDLIAIGETGLDYYYQHASPTVQKDFLRRYFHLAIESQLPIIIHCRDAFTDFFEILDTDYLVSGKVGPGVLHCFTGTEQEAEHLLKRGWYLSLSGIVTFKNSEALRRIAQMAPLDQLLIETDAPYLAPQSKRGKVKFNEPAYLTETAAVVAAIKGISLETLSRAIIKNTCELFKIELTP